MKKIFKKNKLNIIYTSIKILVILLPITFFGLYYKVEAAVMSVHVPESVSIGERVFVDVLIDPQNQSINSVESNFIFSPEYFEFNGFSIKQSSIPIWVEPPKEVKKTPQHSEIYFSGVIPGGIDRIYDPLNIQNKNIPIVRLFFISKKAGSTDFSFGDSSVLLNDGKGTKVVSKMLKSTVLINKNINRSPDTPLVEDINVPNPFTINIIEKSIFGKTPRLASFSADDREGGIQRYEVSVGGLDFHTAVSPFPLPYLLFSYSLIVRAFDYSGNFRDQEITVPGENPYGVGIIVLAGLVIGLFGYRFYNKKRL